MTSTKYPSITWETGIHHEALRILYYLKRLPERELQNRGFLVLPRSYPKLNNKIIVLPQFDYSSLWQKTSRLNPTTPMTAPENLIDQTIELLKPSYVKPSTNLFEIPPNFFKKLFDFLPDYSAMIDQINIIVTNCGTISQFNAITKTHSTLTIYLRTDANLNDLCQVIILSLIRHQLQNQEHRNWGEIQTVSDFILHHTTVGTNIFKSIPMMTALQQKQSTTLNHLSQKYLDHLGIPQQNCWSTKNEQIYFQDKIISGLTLRQQNLLQLLINNYGQKVSLDDIAKILWPNDEDYSLWAMVKEIARIRKCLVNNNLPGSLIKSYRKIGYSLS
jgi:hypothetical protein